MTSAQAIQTIRDCIEADRVIVKDHCAQRLAERGLFWGDVLCLLDSPTRVRSDGEDEFERERWFVSGRLAGDHAAEVLCVIDMDGPTTVFVTVYWEK